MIIAAEPVNVVTNIAKAKRSTFTVKADAKLFQILTKNLYSNPVLSTLSETGQNAYDAHKRAGVADKPFQVTLPNYLDPRLIIRDFGVGMSHSFVMDEYCTAFESSKDTDENQSGGFGIGRLAALALSTTYNIACYDGSKKRTYLIFINNDGVPEINFVLAQDSSEPTGVEITIPIQEKDLHAFENAAKEAYRFYDPKPIIRGAPNFQFIKNLCTISGTDWQIDNSVQSPVAVGGVYWYKIEPDHINILTPIQKELLKSNLGLVLYFSPSEIHPQANRQGLFYNDATCKAIKNKLDGLEIELKNVIQAAFDKCQNIIEAKILWMDYFQMGGPAYNLGRALGAKPTIHWKGHIIDDPCLKVTIPDPDNNGKMKFLDGVSLRSYTSQYSSRGYKRTVRENKVEYKIIVSRKNHIYLNDLEGGRGIKFRIGYALNHVGGIVNYSYNADNTVYYSIAFKDDNARKEFHALNFTDDSIFKSAKAIVIPTTITDQSGDDVNEKHKLKLFKYKYTVGSRNSSSDYWEPAEIDIEEGGIYTPIYRFEPKGITIDALRGKLDIFVRNKIITSNVPIYGVKVTEAVGKAQPEILKELHESEDWILLDKWIEEEREKLVPDSQFSQILVDEGEAQNIIPFTKTAIDRFLGTTMKDYYDKCQFILAQKEKAQKYKQLANDYRSLGGINVSNLTLKPTYKITEEWIKVLKTYPLLKKLTYYNYPLGSEELELAVKYIEDMEDLKKYRENYAPATPIILDKTPEPDLLGS